MKKEKVKRTKKKNEKKKVTKQPFFAIAEKADSRRQIKVI